MNYTKTLILGLLFLPALLSAAPLGSSTWGFQIDPPEGYAYTSGDGKNRFSFSSDENTVLDLAVYDGTYPSVEAMAADITRRLRNEGEQESFIYRRKNAVLMELRFTVAGARNNGWALCMELDNAGKATKPLLLALAYGPEARDELQLLHFSALDSIAPSVADLHAPGPITEYVYPRGALRTRPLAGLDAEALVYENDAVAAQALIDREFEVLRRYASSPHSKEAQLRFYRMIYRDSFDRIANIAFSLEREWDIPALAKRDLAGKVLAWVQSFTYERDLSGSDFVNLVSAALDGRGDCDSRAMLWAIVMVQANIPASIMISTHYSHAMGLADLTGNGARFQLSANQNWLVAETTAKVGLGLIGKDVSDPKYWWGLQFE
jgi:hypothetical protein